MNSPVAAPPWRIDLKIAGVLALAAALATAGLFPYLLQLMPEKLARIPLPLPLLVTVQSLQAFVLLGAPLLRRWLGGGQGSMQRPAPLQAILFGTASGAVVLLCAQWIDPWLPTMINPPEATAAGMSAFNGLLASFYGGIAEELQLRLFLMTLMLWAVARLRRRLPGNAAFHVAIVLAAVLFGVGHLPAAAQLWGLDAIVVLRTIVLNALVGCVCGWLYWRRGLEMAMLAHFSADIVLHVLAPLLKLGAP